MIHNANEFVAKHHRYLLSGVAVGLKALDSEGKDASADGEDGVHFLPKLQFCQALRVEHNPANSNTQYGSQQLCACDCNPLPLPLAAFMESAAKWSSVQPFQSHLSGLSLPRSR